MQQTATLRDLESFLMALPVTWLEHRVGLSFIFSVSLRWSSWATDNYEERGDTPDVFFSFDRDGVHY
jgi:hypothetical protein